MKIIIFKDLLVDEYVPPIQPGGIGAHLLVLDLFYNVFSHKAKEISLLALLRLDRSLLILTELVTNLTSSDGISDLWRKLQSKARMSKRKADRKQKAIETFYRINAKRRDSLPVTTICKVIAKAMLKGGYSGRKAGETIHWTTIRGYLEENGELSTLKK